MLIVATLVVLLLASSPAQAAGDCTLVPSEVHPILDKFLAARNIHAYSGTLLLEQGGRREFIIASSAPGEAVSIQRMNTPDAEAPTRFPLDGVTPEVDACDIGENYRTSLEAGSVVAGRPTLRITAQPRDTLRYGYVMDLDRETGLPLRVQTFRTDGKMIERFEFATFAAELQVPGVNLESPMPSEADAVNPPFGELPAGFRAVEQLGSTSHTVFSDGLTSASVFLEPMPEQLAPGEGAVRHGSTLTYTRGVREAGQTYLATVIGEIPVTTARLLTTAINTRTGG